MAFPTPELGRASTEPTVTASHSVDMPETVTAGSLLIIKFGCRPTTITTPSGWTLLGASTAVDTRLAVYAKTAVGDEGSTSVTISTSTAVVSAHRTLSITGAAALGTQAPELIFDFSDSGSSTPDSPELVPTGGSKDYYWITGYVQRDDGPVLTYPSTYTLNRVAQAITGASTLNTAWASKKEASDRNDPAAFSTTGAFDWSAVTIAVHPSTTGLTTLNCDSSPFVFGGDSVNLISGKDSEPATTWYNGETWPVPTYGSAGEWFPLQTANIILSCEPSAFVFGGDDVAFDLFIGDITLACTSTAFPFSGDDLIFTATEPVRRTTASNTIKTLDPITGFGKKKNARKSKEKTQNSSKKIRIR